jgi:hypothetical protein
MKVILGTLTWASQQLGNYTNAWKSCKEYEHYIIVREVVALSGAPQMPLRETRTLLLLVLQQIYAISLLKIGMYKYDTAHTQ